MTNPDTNPIGYLQEFVQKTNVAPFPKYEEKGSTGPDHAKLFTCQCTYDGFESFASGTTKKQAKTDACRKMVQLLKNNGYFAKHNVNVGDAVSSSNTENLELNTNFIDSSKKYMSLLEDYSQKNRCQLPIYTEIGNVNGMHFFDCHLDGRRTSGQGVSKELAKMEAAIKMLRMLNLDSSNEKEHLPIKEETCRPNVSENLLDTNYVSRLQEYCASKKIQLPSYNVLEKDKNDLFTVSCIVDNVHNTGKSSTKKGAKQIAAMGVLQKLRLEQTPERSSKVVNCLIEEFNKVEKEHFSSPDGFQTLNLSGLDKQHQQFDSASINSISLLQEFCVRNKMEVPTYIEDVNLGGSFLCECNVSEYKTYGQALSKKAAKKNAAFDMAKKLNLFSSTSEMGKLKKDLEYEEEDFRASISYVSKLQEYCDFKHIQKPVYKELGQSMNVFTLSCTVENTQEIGRGSSKSDAKREAAMQVFRKLTQDDPDWLNRELPVEEVLRGNVSASSNLTEFLLDDEETPIDEYVREPIETLNLNDTLVEIEPTPNSENETDLK